MDGFSFHPYPRRATDTLAQGYIWPNAGFVNLDRVKQGLWDAFHGTAQPTTVDGLAAVPRRGGLAGRHDRPDGLCRSGERSCHRRGRAGLHLQHARARGGVRPGGGGGELLRLPGRRAADRLPGRPLPRGRLARDRPQPTSGRRFSTPRSAARACPVRLAARERRRRGGGQRRADHGAVRSRARPVAAHDPGRRRRRRGLDRRGIADPALRAPTCRVSGSRSRATRPLRAPQRPCCTRLAPHGFGSSCRAAFPPVATSSTCGSPRKRTPRARLSSAGTPFIVW